MRSEHSFLNLPQFDGHSKKGTIVLNQRVRTLELRGRKHAIIGDRPQVSNLTGAGRFLGMKTW